MQHKYKFLLAAFLFLFSVISIFPQQQPNRTRILVMQDVVQPSKFLEYETAQKAVNQFITKNKLASAMDCFQTDDFTYMFTIQFSDLKEVDDLYKLWNDKISANSKEFGSLYSAFTGTIKSQNNIVVELGESYVPKNPIVTRDNFGFIHWDYFELIPGKEWETKAMVSEYKKMCEKLQTPLGFRQWNIVFGENSSTIIFSTIAKDDIEFYTLNKKADDLMMKEPGGQEMYMKFLSNVASFEHKNGKPRKDLSIAPSK